MARGDLQKKRINTITPIFTGSIHEDDQMQQETKQGFFNLI
jgi:hypothetical protein